MGDEKTLDEQLYLDFGTQEIKNQESYLQKCTKESVRVILSNEEKDKVLGKLLSNIQTQLLLKIFNSGDFNTKKILSDLLKFGGIFIPYYDEYKKNNLTDEELQIYNKYINTFNQYQIYFTLLKILDWFENNDINKDVKLQDKRLLNNLLKTYDEFSGADEVLIGIFSEEQIVYLLKINKEVLN